MSDPIDDEPEPERGAPTLTQAGERPPRPARFEPGKVIAGRYRVERYLAAGAMGEVYEVEDLELHERVALKRIRPELAGAPAIGRFKREIQLAHKVTHPNVCRIFDLGSDAEDGVFLTMELLVGKTLAERLSSEGRLSAAAARPLVEQIVAGLGAAHAAGIVHRDLKPANIMLVGDRAIITDFGVARPNVGPSDHEVTADGMLVGTPAYMAPEQLLGQEVGPAVDIYALGVVMYQMLTGQLPFAGRTPTVSVALRLRGAPPARIPELDPRWQAAIERCLQPEPADRFPTAAGVVDALAAPPPARRHRRWPIGVAATALVAAAAVFVAARSTHPHAPSRGERASVATLGFRNLSGKPETAWLSTAIAEMLRTELSGSETRSIAGESVARMKADLELVDADGFAADTLARIRKNLASDYVVSGSYAVVGEQIRLDVRLQDARSGDLLVEDSETGGQADLFALVGRAGARLRGGLHAGGPGERALSIPRDPEAARLYSEGLARLRGFDPQAAVPLLEQAAAREPAFPLAHAALAQAWTELDDEPRAEAAAKQAFELAAALPREERLLVEARYREAAHDLPAAIQVYGSLFAFYPDNLEYGLSLAHAQNQAERYADAEATLARLAKLPGALEDPRVDIEASYAATDTAESAVRAESAAQKAEALGARALQARALTNAAWTLAYAGEVDRGRQAALKSRELYRSLGNRLGEFHALNALGPIGAVSGSEHAGLASFDEAAALALAAGARHEALLPLGNAAFVALALDDLPGARERLARLHALSDELGGERAWYVASLEAWLRREEGDLAGAEQKYAESLALKPSDPMHKLAIKQSLALVAADRGQLEQAARELDDTAAGYDQMKSTLSAVEARLDAASAWLDLGRPLDADSRLRAALPAIERGEPARRAYAEALRARVLAAQGNPAEARKAVDEALAAPDPYLTDQVFVAATALELAGGAPARARLEALRAQAAQAGVPRLELEARLALARDAHDRAARAQIGKEATARGLGRLAAQAR